MIRTALPGEAMASAAATRLRRACGVTVALLVLWGSPAQPQDDSGGIPAYLALARELVQNTKPAENRYTLGGQFISLPADAPSATYAVRADCSGFLLAIFERAKYPTRSRMEYLPSSARKRTRPAAHDFVHSIEAEKGFRHIRDARQIRPGDLLAHAMLNVEDQKQTGTTGHVFLLDSPLRPIKPNAPIVAGTQQFEVAVIDSNDEHLGTDDTRLADPSQRVTGLGRGTIRLYLDSGGTLVGWARTFRDTRRFFSYDPRYPSDTRLRKAAIGRPIAQP